MANYSATGRRTGKNPRVSITFPKDLYEILIELSELKDMPFAHVVVGALQVSKPELVTELKELRELQGE